MAANPQNKPIDLGCESAENWQLSSTSTIAIVIITQPVCVRQGLELQGYCLGLQPGWAYYNCDTSTIRLRFEYDTTSYEELCAFEQ